MGQANDQWFIASGASALHKLERHAVTTGTHGDAQGSGRRVAGTGERPEHEKQCLGRLRGKVQPSQGLRPHMRLPEEERTEASGSQDLLRGPQRIGGLRCPEHVERRFGQAPVCGGLWMEPMGRLEQCDRSTSNGTQGRQQQAQLSNAGLLDEQIGESAFWPSAAGQLVHQVLESARHNVHPRRSELRATP